MTEAKATEEKSFKDKVRNSWEVRSLIFIARMLAVVLFIGYLASTWRTAAGWVQLKWVRSQSVAETSSIAEQYLSINKPDKLLEWISLRPAEDRDTIMKQLEPLSGRIGSGVFLLYSKWQMEAGDTEKAVFWRQYALYRLRYDALRCGSPDSAKSMQGLLALFPDTKVQGYINAHPDIVRKSVRQVLDYDARWPAENNPVDICPSLTKLEGGSFKMVPREHWAAIRHTLRFVTEEFLKNK